MMVSKMIAIARINDIPVFNGSDYFSMMTLCCDHTHSQSAERNRTIDALMYEDAVSAACAINPVGTIIASAQAADALLVGTGGSTEAYSSRSSSSGGAYDVGNLRATCGSGGSNCHADDDLGLDAIV